ncbi:MAG: hypothetical protein R6W90_05880 [Ignavibacteriaceae bacterium]
MFGKSAVLLIFFMFVFFNNVTAENAVRDTLVIPDTTAVENETPPQEDNSLRETVSEDFGNRLKSQLNLTDEQTGQVKSIIASYIDAYTDEGSSASANEQIEKLLDEAQKGSWQSVKESFWDDLNRRIKDANE